MDNVTCSDPILDSKQKVIQKGSIVGMAEDGEFSKYQGLVIDPNSDLEDDGYTVAVFFDREVHSHRFWHVGEKMMDTDLWDEKYGRQCPEILLASDIWKQCPRIILFQPSELVVQEEWNTQTLADRLFRGFYHSIYECRIPFKPGTHGCFVKGCDGQATKRTLYNIWGCVSTIYTCDACHTKINGMCADSGPGIKNPVPLPPDYKL